MVLGLIKTNFARGLVSLARLPTETAEEFFLDQFL